MNCPTTPNIKKQGIKLSIQEEEKFETEMVLEKAYFDLFESSDGNSIKINFKENSPPLS